MISVQVLLECVYSMELLSEYMMEVSKSLLLCNIPAVQELRSLASPDAIIPIRFMSLCCSELHRVHQQEQAYSLWIKKHV